MSFENIVLNAIKNISNKQVFPEVYLKKEVCLTLEKELSREDHPFIFYSKTFCYQTSQKQYLICPNQYLSMAILFKDLALGLKPALDIFYEFLIDNTHAVQALKGFESTRNSFLENNPTAANIKDELVSRYNGFDNFFNEIGADKTEAICYSLGRIGNTNRVAKKWIGDKNNVRTDVFGSYIQKIAPLPDVGSSLDKLIEILADKPDCYNWLCTQAIIEDSETDITNSTTVDEKKRLNFGSNILLYGVPGSGKSYTISTEYCKEIPEDQIQRVVFHPEYSYSDFIGQILPTVSKLENGESTDISYNFVPGPFTEILANAYNNPTKHYILIIEELNRGNAPAIFGEMFQLLDRKTEIKPHGDNGLQIGSSEYGITNKDVALIVYGDENHKVYIPSNLEILATMNTSDQNVFTLDTAFQRRWQMRLVENSFDTVKTTFEEAKILDTSISWKKFCTVVNELIINCQSDIASSEDKRLGVFFITESDLVGTTISPAVNNDNTPIPLAKEYSLLLKKKADDLLSSIEQNRLDAINKALLNNRKFPEKVLKYLWDDAFKFNRDDFFKQEMTTLEKVISSFVFESNNSRWTSILSDKAIDALGLSFQE